jgi:putative DNA primase/helicase
MLPTIKLKYDGPFDIAVGRSRKETNWKNKEMLWSDFISKVSITHYTAETQAEYITAKKPRQDEIKDIGGFVGGYLSSGRRKSGNVIHRQLVTLDIDYSKEDIWGDLEILFSNAAVMYSTHKHSYSTPRYRLIFILDRAVMPDEYEAIARYIAGVIDIELFDPTTFQAERLMYWPSTSKDGEFIFEFQDGPFIKADEILAKYRDWKDCSEWPVSSRVDKILQRSMQKQGDPLEKSGVVGAFCRAYTISECIESHLIDAYESCDTENRYTYKGGSTGAGLVIYEDKFAFSHHGTDPTSGKLCNAFDLVRIHKFGLKDEGVKEGTPGNKIPSYTAMREFCTRDNKVKKQLDFEQLQNAQRDFAEFDVEEQTLSNEEPENDEWRTELAIDGKGNKYSTIANVSLILDNDPRLKGRFATDEFLKRKVILKNLPWRKLTPDTKYLKDEDELNLLKYLEKAYSITHRGNIKAAFDIHIDANGFHPVRDYLQRPVWDKVPRLDNLFIDYMGAANSEYTKTVTRKTLTAAVARIFEPGIKFDYVLTFVGKEGLGKSSLIGMLSGAWFSDSFNFNMLHQGNKAYEQIQGFWLIEIAELAGLKKADVDAAKQYISKREDSFRPSYGRNVLTFKRQCIFIGSTNNNDFLVSQTGNRRFWPVTCWIQQPTKNVFKDLSNYEIEQIWAEAVLLYKAGETLYLQPEMEAVAKQIQSEHSEIDGRAGIIQKYLNTKLPNDWASMDIYQRRGFLKGDETMPEGVHERNRVCGPEIWCEILGGQEKDCNRQNTKDIHNIMRSMDGWVETKGKITFGLYGQQKGYRRIKKLVIANNTPTTKLKSKLDSA